MAVIDRLVGEFDRPGKAAGAGFYDYPADGPKRLWPGLAEHFAAAGGVEPGGAGAGAGAAGAVVGDEVFADLQERFTFAMSLETVRCVAEGVLRSTAEANIGSIFGIGFPALHGGALQYINNYQGRDGATGVAAFEARARVLAASYGSRFESPALLVDKAATDEPF
jgi:3-hydroxyacyl-CoA dehydrogenase/enoyl-CoA hydratase/3-hydroxybutyryl-CoA epimerase